MRVLRVPAGRETFHHGLLGSRAIRCRASLLALFPRPRTGWGARCLRPREALVTSAEPRLFFVGLIQFAPKRLYLFG
jgi:hypothetical protein